MFERCRGDKTGLEPRKLFNVVEFMMHDKDASGTIDMDECMEILFRRFGKDQLEERTNEFFKHDTDGDNIPNYADDEKLVPNSISSNLVAYELPGLWKQDLVLAATGHLARSRLLAPALLQS